MANMGVFHSHRQASVDEIAKEMDRRGAVIETLEADAVKLHAEIARLKAEAADLVEAIMLKDDALQPFALFAVNVMSVEGVSVWLGGMNSMEIGTAFNASDFRRAHDGRFNGLVLEKA